MLLVQSLSPPSEAQARRDERQGELTKFISLCPSPVHGQRPRPLMTACSRTQVECCPVPVDGVLVDIATNSDQTLLATVTSASSDWHTVRVWAAAQSDFTNIATWTTKDAVHHITWAQPEFGPLLAGATESGTVHIWHQEPASTSGSVAEEQNKHEIKYKLGCSLSHAGKGISCLRFAPARHGLLLAVGTNEAVFVYEADRPLAPDVWTLQSRIDVRVRGGGVVLARGLQGALRLECSASAVRVRTRALSELPPSLPLRLAPSPLPQVPGGARSISWRPFSMCVPPMLLLGGAQGASVWMYSLPLMAWQVRGWLLQ